METQHQQGNFTVLSTTPQNGAVDVRVDQTIKIVFSTAMLGTTINNTNITLSNGGSVATTVSLFRDDCTVFVIPDSNLSANTTYTCIVTTNVKSLFGQQPLSAQHQFSFTTAAGR